MKPEQMLSRFQEFIATNALLQKNEPVLLAVSGGVDSVVMCRLFSLAAMQFGIAHCNFRLRGNDSNGDAVFVAQFAHSLNMPFFSAEFETVQYSEKKGISIEMAARELRYEWLEKIRKENGYHKIATAHHRDDSIETVLLNLTKGTGISGLHGILPQRGKIIRPLLAFGKEELLSFAASEKLQYRQDCTNHESVFQRNFLRNEVLPKLKQLNPNFSETFAENIEKFKDTEAIYKKGLEYFRKKLLEKRGQEFYIPIKKLLMYAGSRTLLFELLRDFGFGENQTAQIFVGMKSEPGKQFFSENFRVIKDRGFLIVASRQEELSGIILVENISKPFNLPDGTLSFHLMQGAKVNGNANQDKAFIDFSKLEFPLLLRRWKTGDYFYPQGMGGKKKKLSDFFTDIKLSLLEKERVWILESGNKIAWVVGHRIDERFSVVPRTQKTLVIKWK